MLSMSRTAEHRAQWLSLFLSQVFGAEDGKQTCLTEDRLHLGSIPCLLCVLTYRVSVRQVCKVADRIGVGVYFNTLVPVEGQVVTPRTLRRAEKSTVWCGSVAPVLSLAPYARCCSA